MDKITPAAEHDELRTETSRPDALEAAKQHQAQADAATQMEHAMTVRQALARYPMAVVWSVLFCVCIIMDGYDSDLITNLYGLPAFQRTFGVPTTVVGGGASGLAYTVPARWQTAFAMSSPVGRVVGGLVQGHLAEALGRKRTLGVCLVLLAGFVFLPFFAASDAVLMAGEMLCGVVWGILSSLAPTYASELCPLRLRDLLTAYVNLCWSTGQLLASGVLAGYADNTTEWAYRVPFALQWLWPVLILGFLWWAPESPYWLVRRGRDAEARAVLRRLTRNVAGEHDADTAANSMLALVQRTDERERLDAVAGLGGAGGYLACFRGTNRRRTEISCMAWAMQILCGLSLPFYAVVFFEQAGFPPQQAFNMNVGMTALGFVGTCTAIALLIPRLGRRTLYLGGMLFLTALMLLIGILGCVPGRRAPVLNAAAGLLILWFFVYFLTVGPVAYVVFTETSATRLRGHTVALALVAYSTLGIAYNVASPYLINDSAAGLGAKTGLVYGGIAILACIWCYFRLPECKNRTFEELDILFARKVPTRQFKDYVIEE